MNESPPIPQDAHDPSIPQGPIHVQEPPPILQGIPPTDEQKRLVALFDELEKGQIEFLDQAGKRIIELSTGLLGVLFAVTALGDKFPPPYLEDKGAAQVLAALTLALFMGALLVGVWSVQPRQYRRYEHNVSEMRKELGKIVSFKSRRFKTASALFVLGALALALLIGAVIFSA
ncbi:MAG: hypothetical protein PVF45_11760 [Anaerolineae bacterium]|jgi:hypothetical protein